MCVVVTLRLMSGKFHLMCYYCPNKSHLDIIYTEYGVTMTVQGVTHDHILREGVPISYNSLAEEGTSNIEPKAFLVDLLAVAPGPSMYLIAF